MNAYNALPCLDRMLFLLSIWLLIYFSNATATANQIDDVVTLKTEQGTGTGAMNASSQFRAEPSWKRAECFGTEEVQARNNDFYRVCALCLVSNTL